jgi:hypothetical protein
MTALAAWLPMGEADRAVTAGRTEGFVKIIAGRRRVLGAAGGGRVLGATIVAARAGEMIHEMALAMRTGMSTGRLAQTVHAYPTWSLAIQPAAALFFGEFGGRTARPAGPAGGEPPARHSLPHATGSAPDRPGCEQSPPAVPRRCLGIRNGDGRDGAANMPNSRPGDRGSGARPAPSPGSPSTRWPCPGSAAPRPAGRPPGSSSSTARTPNTGTPADQPGFHPGHVQAGLGQPPGGVRPAGTHPYHHDVGLYDVHALLLTDPLLPLMAQLEPVRDNARARCGQAGVSAR